MMTLLLAMIEYHAGITVIEKFYALGFSSAEMNLSSPSFRQAWGSSAIIKCHRAVQNLPASVLVAAETVKLKCLHDKSRLQPVERYR